MSLYWAMVCLLGALAIINRVGIPKEWDNREGKLAGLSEALFAPAGFTLLGLAILAMTPAAESIPTRYIAIPVFVGYQSLALVAARPRDGETEEYRPPAGMPSSDSGGASPDGSSEGS
jgi:hypothetical protein